MLPERNINNYVYSPVLGDKPGRDLYMHDYPVGDSAVRHRGRDEWTSHIKMVEWIKEVEKVLNKQLDKDNLWTCYSYFSKSASPSAIPQIVRWGIGKRRSLLRVFLKNPFFYFEIHSKKQGLSQKVLIKISMDNK